MKRPTINPLVLYGGLAVGAYFLLRFAAPKVLEAINPLSTENIFYKGASAVTSAITGQDSPLGIQLWEWWNPEAVALEKVAVGAPVEFSEGMALWRSATGGVVPPYPTDEEAMRAWAAVQKIEVAPR